MYKLLLLAICFFLAHTGICQIPELKGFDARVEKIMKDWSTTGCAIGIVKGGKLIYSKGFGFRDVEKKLPVTPTTLFPIASNTKLFTSTAIAMIAAEGKLALDKPVKEQVQQIDFGDNMLNSEVTLRDMLSHRTGIKPNDFFWYGSDESRESLFRKIRYMKQSAPLREKALYNNMMYLALGQIIEIKTGMTWEAFVAQNFLAPLGMTNTNFSVEEMEKQEDYAKPYRVDLLTKTVSEIPFDRKLQAVGPSGGINSNLNDLANWVACQLGKGKFNGIEIFPQSVYEETMAPASFFSFEPELDPELSKSQYGMGRIIVNYKGHLMTKHGGLNNGFMSQIALFPNDDLGIIILTNTIGQYIPTFLYREIADRMLGLGNTPWHERIYSRTMKQMRAAVPGENDRTVSAAMSRPASEYIGTFEHPAFGRILITLKGEELWYEHNYLYQRVSHLHDDHFETNGNDLWFPKIRLEYVTDLHGHISRLLVSTEEMTDEAFLKKQ